MAYLRFIWYRVRKADGTETVHRWAENASHHEDIDAVFEIAEDPEYGDQAAAIIAVNAL